MKTRKLKDLLKLKLKLKRLQLETVRKAIKQSESVEDVKEANAVIVNPTHFAVALKYDVGSPGAPKSLSMGRGYDSKENYR